MKRVIDWAKAHPRLAAWIVLGLGMDAMVAYEARDVGLLAGQWIALIVPPRWSRDCACGLSAGKTTTKKRPRLTNPPKNRRRLRSEPRPAGMKKARLPGGLFVLWEGR